MREERRRLRREAILTVATRSFLVNGYAGTSMSQIAAELGGSKGTLWSYFPSKDALFGAVIDNATISYREQLSKVLDPGGDLRAALCGFGTSLLTKITSPEGVALYRVVVAEVPRFPELGRIFFERAPRVTISMLAGFLAGAVERSVLLPVDPERAARHLIALTTSGCYQKLLLGVIESPTPEMIAADVEYAVDLFLRAFVSEQVEG